MLRILCVQMCQDVSVVSSPSSVVLLCSLGGLVYSDPTHTRSDSINVPTLPGGDSGGSYPSSPAWARSRDFQGLWLQGGAVPVRRLKMKCTVAHDDGDDQ